MCVYVFMWVCLCVFTCVPQCTKSTSLFLRQHATDPLLHLIRGYLPIHTPWPLGWCSLLRVGDLAPKVRGREHAHSLPLSWFPFPLSESENLKVSFPSVSTDYMHCCLSQPSTLRLCKWTPNLWLFMKWIFPIAKYSRYWVTMRKTESKTKTEPTAYLQFISYQSLRS